MPQIENSPRLITPDQFKWRRRAATVISLAVPSEKEIIGDTDGLTRFKEDVKSGIGGLILYLHYSADNPFVVANEVMMKDPLLSQIFLSAPIGQHQHDILWGIPASQAPRLGAEVYPVVTPHALKKYLKEHKNVQKTEIAADIQKKFDDYLLGMLNALKLGRIGLLAPQAERENRLTKSHLKVMKKFFEKALELDILDFDILFTAPSIKGETLYRRGKTDGLNLRRQCVVTIGPCYNAREVLIASGGVENIDEWTGIEMAKIADPSYIDHNHFDRLITPGVK